LLDDASDFCAAIFFFSLEKAPTSESELSSEEKLSHSFSAFFLAKILAIILLLRSSSSDSSLAISLRVLLFSLFGSASDKESMQVSYKYFRNK